MTIFRFLGRQAYLPIYQAMQRFTSVRNAHTEDEIWFLEHEPVYTQGMAGKAEHLLNTSHIPVVQTDRGGQITYHGPGQLIVYFLIDIERRALAARDLVSLIEKALVNLLQIFGILAYARKEAPGIYLDVSSMKTSAENHAKIASLGLRVRNKAAYHGLALNVKMDLLPFLNINPCGFVGMKMVQMSDLKDATAMPAVEKAFLQILQGIF